MASKMDQGAVELREYAKNMEDSSKPTSLEQSALLDEEFFQRNSKSMVRKLDKTLMPIVWVLYMFNYLDRNNIS